MYTQCPECQIAFRVTVKVLQKASGRVRCGGCGIAFSAIEHLSDELPATDIVQPETVVDTAPAADEKDEFEARNTALLKTLEELAGPEDVRIEDTGIEWRVLDDGEIDESAATPDIQPEPQQAAASSERRYDDDTPLSDSFENDLHEHKLIESAPPELQPTDADGDTADRDTHQVEMALSDDDWAGLLDDDQDSPANQDVSAPMIEPALTTPDDLDLQFNLQAEAMGLDVSPDEAPDLTADTELPREDSNAFTEDAEDLPTVDSNAFTEDAEDLPAVDSESYAVDEDELSPEEEADIVKKLRDSTGSFQKQIESAKRALEQGDIDIYEEPAATLEAHDINDTEAIEESTAALLDDELEDMGMLLQADEDARSSTNADDGTVDLPFASTAENQASPDMSSSWEESPEEPQDEIDLLSQTMIQAGIDPATLDTENIETIVMEGNFVFDSVEGDSNAENDLGKQESLVDTYMLNKQPLGGGRRKSDSAGFGVIAGVVVLAIVLLAQYVHASREIFATYGAFNQTLGPVYRALGKPVTPQWNIKGWQFESTHGSMDDNEVVLTVSSHIRNTSDKPLPYPLVHVSLTDRWEEIIGSKVLGPSEYLAGDLDPRQAVAPGDAFTAVIAIKKPSAEATGFQLYACYRTSPGQMRCATEDFKN